MWAEEFPWIPPLPAVYSFPFNYAQVLLGASYGPVYERQSINPAKQISLALRFIVHAWFLQLYFLTFFLWNVSQKNVG